MANIRIKIVSIGHTSMDLRKEMAAAWRSRLFTVVYGIERYTLSCNSDTDQWGFSDERLSRELPSKFDADLLIAVVSVPLQDNYYARILDNNRIVVSLYETKYILESANIPPINLIHRLLYIAILLYRAGGDCIPSLDDALKLSHDETRGCLFDMNGIKTDVSASCHKPIICQDCRHELQQRRVSKDVIEITETEIKKIRKTAYFRIIDFLKVHPVWSIFISSGFAILVGIISSLIASEIYSLLRHA